MSGFLADADLSANTIEQARLRAAAGAGYIDLTSSNPTAQGLLFPPEILRAAADSFWDTRRYRPDARGDLRARQAIAAYYARRGDADVTPENIFITASTSEAYSHLFALLCEPGDNVLAPQVSYPLFEHLAALHHVELRPYAMDEARGWSIDEGDLRGAVDARTRAVLLVSPHNPTGMIVQHALPALNALSLPLICDEVFAEMVFRAPNTPPLGALHSALPVFTLNGISKLFALPDLKLGWVAMNPVAATRFGARFELLNDAFLSANALTQHMLPALFEHGWPFAEAMRARIHEHLDYALTMLAGCPNLRVQPPDGGYYLFPRVLGWDDEDALVVHLLKHGVLAHPGYFYGLDADTHGAHVMISCLTEKAQLRAGLARLIAALSTTTG